MRGYLIGIGIGWVEVMMLQIWPGHLFLTVVVAVLLALFIAAFSSGLIKIRWK